MVFFLSMEIADKFGKPKFVFAFSPAKIGVFFHLNAADEFNLWG